MSNYIERYSIAGRVYGIEDYQAPGSHFFAKDQEFRFKCWVSGCGFGTGHNTIEEARQHIRTYATEYLLEKVIDMEVRLDQYREAMIFLKDSLKEFRVSDQGADSHE